jgi:hypothetical protein
MSDTLVNQWTVEITERDHGAETAAKLGLDMRRVFEGDDAEERAERWQNSIAAHGVASQLFHERHVLMKESKRWRPGGGGKSPGGS